MRPLLIAVLAPLAVHEAGHAAVAHYLSNTDPLYKVTIIPRGTSLGGTQQLPLVERHVYAEGYLRDRLAVALGGRAAEQVFLGETSSGADEDIRVATRLARAMVTRWGMAPELGPIDVRTSDDHPFLGRELAEARLHSEETAKRVDQAVCVLLGEADDRAREALKARRAQVEALAHAVDERETLDRPQVDALLGPRNSLTVPVAAPERGRCPAGALPAGTAPAAE